MSGTSAPSSTPEQYGTWCKEAEGIVNGLDQVIDEREVRAYTLKHPSSIDLRDAYGHALAEYGESDEGKLAAYCSALINFVKDPDQFRGGGQGVRENSDSLNQLFGVLQAAKDFLTKMHTEAPAVWTRAAIHVLVRESVALSEVEGHFDAVLERIGRTLSAVEEYLRY